MKRLLPLLMFLFCPAWASAQIVTPGGGGSVANGTVIGGSCPANQFVSAIGSPTGVPTCAVPPSGTGYPAGAPAQIGGYASTNNSEAETLSGDATLSRLGVSSYGITVTKTSGVPFSGLATAVIPLIVGNGGTGTATAPAIGQMLIANSVTGYAPVTMGGDCSITSAGVITCTKTNTVPFSALATASVPLTIANGGRGSSIAPSAGMIDIAQSATTFQAMAMSGDATITSTGAITVTKLSGTTPGGVCGANLFVSTISASGVPTCTAPSFAPLNNPAGGQNNYAPLSNASLSSPTFTGTMSFPDGSTYTAAGHSTMKALGVGVAAPATAGQIQATGLVTSPSELLTLEATTGNAIYMGPSTTSPYGTISAGSTSSLPAVNLASGAHAIAAGWSADATSAVIEQWKTGTPFAAIINYVNTGLTVGNTFTPQLVSQSTVQGFGIGMTIPADASVTPLPSTLLYAGGIQNPAPTAYFQVDAGMYQTAAGFKVTDTNGANGFVVHHYFNTHEIGWNMGCGIAAGSIYDGTTGRCQNLVLRDKNYGGVAGGQQGLYLESGQIIAQNGPLLATANVSGQEGVFIQNNSNATTAQTMVRLTNDAGIVGYLINEGSGYTQGGGPQAPSTLGLFGSSNVWLAAEGTGVTNQLVSIWSGNVKVGQFANTAPQVSGLELGGYAGAINGNNGCPALMLANGYYGGETWAELDQSGAAYYNCLSGQWIADGGAGSGVGLYQNNQGVFTWFYGGAYSSGQTVAWNPIMIADSTGLKVSHIQNNQNYGVPTCVNCLSFNNGSRDTAGYVQVSGTWPITINFAKAFQGTAICTGSALGGPGMIWFGNNSATSIQMTCTLPGGAVCSTSPTAWIAYHCFGNGA